jgi:hypothetical protein
MQVIDGIHSGKKGDIVTGLTGGTLIRVDGKKYNIKKDLARFKQINKSEERTGGQLIICILLGLTVIGLPIAILLLFIWKKIQWSAGCQTKSGDTFVFESNSRSEYRLASKFFGIGAAADF